VTSAEAAKFKTRTRALMGRPCKNRYKSDKFESREAIESRDKFESREAFESREEFRAKMCQTKIRAFLYFKNIAHVNTFFYENGHKSSKKSAN
jgi:hypothetical protein